MSTDTLAIGDQLTLTLTVTNPATVALEGITLTQELTPALSLVELTGSNGFGCTTWQECADVALPPGQTLVTVTYTVLGADLVGKPITATSTLQHPGLVADEVETIATKPITPQQTFLPVVRRSAVSLYANWRKLVQPSSGVAVNYLYISQDPAQCVGPVVGQALVEEQALPVTILAATNKGLYQLEASQTVNTPSNSWILLNGTDGISISHVISTTHGYFAGAFNQGSVLFSPNLDTLWEPQALPNDNQFINWLASSDEYVLAAGNRGLFVRQEDGSWQREQALRGVVFNVVAAGTQAYAVEIVGGNEKDRLWYSDQGGKIGSWQVLAPLPDPIRFIQMLDFDPTAEVTLLVGAVGNGIYQLDGDTLKPFALEPRLTAYGFWRDPLGQVYSAFREPGGIQRFAPSGGLGTALGQLDGDPIPSTARLYTVNGNPSSQCGILAVGSREGDVWLRRIPIQ